MLTVNGDRDAVERQLGSGELACPSCGGVLGRWGNAVTRPVRQLKGDDEVVTPRRSRCRGCRATHVLLPAQLLSRRADAGAVVGRALEEKAAGAGHRKIAGLLGRPESTVRGWLRALARGAGRVRERFTALAASWPSRTASGSPRRLHIACERIPQCVGMLGVQVDLVLGAVQAEADCAFSLAAIEVVDEQGLYLLSHMCPVSSLSRSARQTIMFRLDHLRRVMWVDPGVSA